MLPQLKKMYVFVQLGGTVRYCVPQSQGMLPLCGAFATANALLLLCNKIPTRHNFIRESMRKHLYQCLLNGFFDVFPEHEFLEIQCSKDTFYTNIEQYLDDQKNKEKDKSRGIGRLRKTSAEVAATANKVGQ